ncbi:MAG: ATP-dependent helicase [Chloroflexi bacterium]|mgnify:CR=1 FL=1|nr:ATP-dependent helicase [Chloroflexota bacterium]
MGVSAVPGSGKTHILSYLASQLVATSIDEDQEVLIVTMMNSAVDNFSRRIAEFMQREAGLLPNVGYRVRTLHGLAVDIVRERPALVGLSETFDIVDERAATRLLEDIVQSWVSAHTDVLTSFLMGDIDDNKARWLLRDRWPGVVQDVALAFIRRAKDQQMTPAGVREALSGSEQRFTLATLGAEIYELYQRALMYRGSVDFQDLIVLALRALESDAELLARLQRRWPFVLEDEAQDSSRLQQRILELLSGPNGNWVRVGDPNQSVHTTFTTANPQLLLDFMDDPLTKSITMPNSGRCARPILALANQLVDWTVAEHPSPACRDAFRQQHIEPTPPDDPQPNPSHDGRVLYIDGTAYAPEAELKTIIESLARWVPAHPDETVAVLVPRNEKGFQVSEALRNKGVPFAELLQSTISTRKTAGALVHVLRHLVDPMSAAKLARCYEVWRRDDRGEDEVAERNDEAIAALRRLRNVEDYLWPRLGNDWLAEIEAGGAVREVLGTFREVIQRWHRAAGLPVDQLLITLGQDLFTDPPSLALTHKLAALMRQIGDDDPTLRLPELADNLAEVAKNERRFLGFDQEDNGFEPPKGVVTVTTMHKAKGLEWDRVYLMSVNSYDFPSDLPSDTYVAEKWFVRDSLNLVEEALAQLASLSNLYAGYVEGRATRQARQDYVKERLRLLYVGITRARRDLILTWNTGKGRLPAQPAIPLVALQTWLEEKR